jgi:hypothetical protein
LYLKILPNTMREVASSTSKSLKNGLQVNATLTTSTKQSKKGIILNTTTSVGSLKK